MGEQIVLLDESHNPIGAADKFSSHHANTPLHLAFSCYIFDEGGRFLLTQRASTKKVWPGVWTNSICGHPAPGESFETAIRRRAAFELGLRKVTDITKVLPDYRYTTPPFNGIIENEFCPVFFARATQTFVPNPEEVMDFVWERWNMVLNDVEAKPKEYSYWFKDQLSQLKCRPEIKEYTRPGFKDITL